MLRVKSSAKRVLQVVRAIVGAKIEQDNYEMMKRRHCEKF